MKHSCLPVLATAVTLAALAAPARAEDTAATADDAAAPARAEDAAAPARAEDTAATADDAAATAEDAAATAPAKTRAVPAKTRAARIPVPAEVWAPAPPEGEAQSAQVEEVAQKSESRHRFGLAVNWPVGWFGKSFAASAYVALDQHNVLRGNVALFPNSRGLRGLAAIAVRSEDSDHLTGRLRDAGAAWVWYPDGLWHGFTFEAGVLLRERRTQVEEWSDVTETESITYAGRMMLGWSWLLGDRVFLSIAAGLSMGYETGTETPDPGPGMKMTRSIGRPQVDGEGYLRLGFAFGG